MTPSLTFLRTIMLVFVLVLTNQLIAQPFLKAHPHINPYQYEIVKEKSFDNGAVTSAHPLASMVGAAMMQDGGNAFDAAIATQLSLAVVFPGAGNIGGGGFLLARKVNGELIGIDYREAAPSKASRDMYLDDQGNPIEGKSTRGASASGIPGSIAGMISTHAYAKLAFAKLIEPAIELAEFGFVISEKEAKGLNADRENFLKFSSAPSAFTKKEVWKAGDTLIQPELAATLKRIQAKGLAGFYEGATAEYIVKEMQHSGGYVSLEDLKNYTPKFRKPIEFDYRGHHIISFAPPSSGGILIAQMMQMIAPFNVEKMGLNTLASVNLMVESQRRAYADRAEHMGDPDYWKVPTKTLISNSYAQARMSDYKEGVAGSSKITIAGQAHESEQTTHLSVIDKEGNMVAITTTLNDTYGNKTIVAGAGFLLNNEMDDFSIKPGVPNMYGALGGEANSIQPGKRMLSSMTPTLVTLDGKPYISIGTPGGTTIPNQVYEGLVNIIDHKMTIKQAIDATRFHHQWIPDVVALESDFPEDIETGLKNMGYKTIKRGKFGRMDGILISGDGKRMAAGDKRGDDSVAGY
ncbi:MAG: gamma-glutamyltransferase [Chitinophagaceae bacterium]|nr:gamma-glutamyltransferase [Chitinophagaceae bacterium]